MAENENKIDDGGPAFPGEQGHIPDGTWNQTWESGISRRDYFVARAMQGFLANPKGTDIVTFGDHSIGKASIIAADSVLKELQNDK